MGYICVMCAISNGREQTRECARWMQPDDLRVTRLREQQDIIIFAFPSLYPTHSPVTSEVLTLLARYAA
jgi:hypothetical protein